MYSITSQFGQVQYNVVKLVVDTEADIESLPTDFTPGSQAFVVENSTIYMLNNAKEWKLVTISSGGGGGESGELDSEWEGIS